MRVNFSTSLHLTLHICTSSAQKKIKNSTRNQELNKVPEKANRGEHFNKKLEKPCQDVTLQNIASILNKLGVKHNPSFKFNNNNNVQ